MHGSFRDERPEADPEQSHMAGTAHGALPSSRPHPMCSPEATLRCQDCPEQLCGGGQSVLRSDGTVFLLLLSYPFSKALETCSSQAAPEDSVTSQNHIARQRDGGDQSPQQTSLWSSGHLGSGLLFNPAASSQTRSRSPHTHAGKNTYTPVATLQLN